MSDTRENEGRFVWQHAHWYSCAGVRSVCCVSALTACVSLCLITHSLPSATSTVAHKTHWGLFFAFVTLFLASLTENNIVKIARLEDGVIISAVAGNDISRRAKCVFISCGAFRAFQFTQALLITANALVFSYMFSARDAIRDWGQRSTYVYPANIAFCMVLKM